MATTIAVRFPLGRYHANPWDRSVNEGTTEWPPSPWRLLRALVATWHTRWPDLPASALDGLLDALGDPPSYRAPDGWAAHTRHYLPDLDHKKGEAGGTDLTLDPFVWLGRAAVPEMDLLIQWPADLSDEQRAVLAKLSELLPYLGRAESICEARLLDTSPAPDELWWRPGTDGSWRARLLAPDRPVTRDVLEISTAEVRRQRRTLPPGTIWVPYAAGQPAPQRRPPGSAPHLIEAVRFAVTGQVPLKSTHGVLLADAAHRVVGRKLTAGGISDDRRRALLGSGGAATDHSHAHWVPIAEGAQRGTAVKALVLWVPHGLQQEEVAEIITLRHLSGRMGGRENSGYEIRGFPEVRLLFQAAGTIAQVAPELCGSDRNWQSLTPYLPVRHRKRETLDEYLTTDVLTELRYRQLPAAKAMRADPDGGLPDRWAREFRRYRTNERLTQSRPGLGLRLQFAAPVTGPVLLGQLSHFGYGIFTPELG